MVRMHNDSFVVDLDEKSGSVCSIQNPNDGYKMNWCAEGELWGRVLTRNGMEHDAKDMALLRFSAQKDQAQSVYSNGILQVTVDRFFRSKDRFVERYTIRNLLDADVFVGEDDLGIVIPFNDRYPSGEECMTNHCHAHIWCGEHTTYVNAMRMGISQCNLGLVLTKGAIQSYSQLKAGHSNRGLFVLNTAFFTLLSGESHTIEWEIFWHQGSDDFTDQVSQGPQSILIRAAQHTVFMGESIGFTVQGALDIGQLRVVCNGACVQWHLEKGQVTVNFLPEKAGKYVFKVISGDIATWAEFLVSEPLDTLAEKRVDFILKYQQYHRWGSPLDGAFLIFDNRNKHVICENSVGDHNACRERIGMALLLAKYLQKKNDPEKYTCLLKYIDFLKREFYDEKTGEVFNTIGKKQDILRLYNAPWVMRLFAEMYAISGDSCYTNHIVKIADWYYANGGVRFYPNAVCFQGIMDALNKSKHKDANRILRLFYEHAEQMLRFGTHYPKHEVNFEQTIVTPAATLLTQMAMITGEDRFREAAKEHIEILERFAGNQPSYHLQQIPIRFWDDFWFGKSKVYGDTFPHYWSSLSAVCFEEYFRLTGDARYQSLAQTCMLNCLCLFFDTGEASSAYVYPHKVDDRNGEFYDEWANDQDFALYLAMDIIHQEFDRHTCLAEKEKRNR